MGREAKPSKPWRLIRARSRFVGLAEYLGVAQVLTTVNAAYEPVALLSDQRTGTCLKGRAMAQLDCLHNNLSLSEPSSADWLIGLSECIGTAGVPFPGYASDEPVVDVAYQIPFERFDDGVLGQPSCFDHHGALAIVRHVNSLSRTSVLRMHQDLFAHYRPSTLITYFIDNKYLALSSRASRLCSAKCVQDAVITHGKALPHKEVAEAVETVGMSGGWASSPSS